VTNLKFVKLARTLHGCRRLMALPLLPVSTSLRRLRNLETLTYVHN